MVRSKLSRYKAAVVQQSRETQLISGLKRERESLTLVQNLVNTTAESLQQKVHTQISNVVSRCLTTVFGENSPQFKIVFSKKRGRTEAELLFYHNGTAMDPLEAVSGGVLDIAAFALRLACLLSSTPQRRPFIVLDEPVRHLALQARPLFAKLLEELSAELNIQFLVVTHFSELETTGKVIRI